MGVVLQHLLRDVSGNVPDGCVTRATLRKVGNQRVPVVMPPPFHLRFAFTFFHDVDAVDISKRINWVLESFRRPVIESHYCGFQID